jgi:hypothetical protein
MDQGAIITDVIGCHICNGTHASLIFRPLSRAPFSRPQISHWATCPGNGEPLLAYIEAARPVRPVVFGLSRAADPRVN